MCNMHCFVSDPSLCSASSSYDDAVLQEPIGTHGAMKCMFDGVVQQRDAVCASLFKRSFPVWPTNLDFCS